MPLRHSDIKINETFSSKERTIQFLKNCITHRQSKKYKGKFVIKPIYGAGSLAVRISRKYSFRKTEIIQDYMTGIKGSFSMLCKIKSLF